MKFLCLLAFIAVSQAFVLPENDCGDSWSWTGPSISDCDIPQSYCVPAPVQQCATPTYGGCYQQCATPTYGGCYQRRTVTKRRTSRRRSYGGCQTATPAMCC